MISFFCATLLRQKNIHEKIEMKRNTYLNRYLNTYLIKTIMARRRIEDKNIRKLSRIGNKSIGLTLPIDMVRELGWREKQKVMVKRVHGGILIKDWK